MPKSVLPFVINSKESNSYDLMDSIHLSFTLKYTEYDSSELILGVVIDLDNDNEYDDTIKVRSTSFDYSFLPHKLGKNIIKGLVAEINDIYGGVDEFEYDFEVK